MITILSPVQSGAQAPGVVVVSGQTEPGQSVNVFIDGQTIGTAAAATSGIWQLSTPLAVLGRHTVVASRGAERVERSFDITADGRPAAVGETIELARGEGSIAVYAVGLAAAAVIWWLWSKPRS